MDRREEWKMMSLPIVLSLLGFAAVLVFLAKAVDSIAMLAWTLGECIADAAIEIHEWESD